MAGEIKEKKSINGDTQKKSDLVQDSELITHEPKKATKRKSKSSENTTPNSSLVVILLVLIVFISIGLTGLSIGSFLFVQQNYNSSRQELNELSDSVEQVKTDLTSLSLTVTSLNQGDPQNLPQPPKPELKNYPGENDKFFGNEATPFTLIMYSDLECPFCKQAHPTVKTFIEQNSSQVNLAYRHFPLTTIHPNARRLGVLTECAYNEGGKESFYDAIDYIYSLNTPSSVTPESLAQTLNFDSTRMTACSQDTSISQRVDAQNQQAFDDGVNGTPSMFLVNNETRDAVFIVGAVPLQQLQTELDNFSNP